MYEIIGNFEISIGISIKFCFWMPNNILLRHNSNIMFAKKGDCEKSKICKRRLIVQRRNLDALRASVHTGAVCYTYV